MTQRMSDLSRDAEAAGYTVRRDEGGIVAITRPAGRWGKPEGLVIYPDGTAFDVSVDLQVAKGLRSYDSMRKTLGI